MNNIVSNVSKHVFVASFPSTLLKSCNLVCSLCRLSLQRNSNYSNKRMGGSFQLVKQVTAPSAQPVTLTNYCTVIMLMHVFRPSRGLKFSMGGGGGNSGIWLHLVTLHSIIAQATPQAKLLKLINLHITDVQ